MAAHDQMLWMQERIQMLTTQLETIAGELDKVKSRPAGCHQGQSMRSDGAPQFFNPKTMQPEVFKGGPRENFAPWARKVRNYLNAHLYGLRALLLQVETSNVAVSDDHINSLEIPNPSQVSNGIHTFLIGCTEGAPNTIVDNAMGNGFEAWRRLVREYDPQSTEHNFGRMQTVMRQPRVKHLREFTARVESWEREVRTLVERTKQPIPEWMLTND